MKKNTAFRPKCITLVEDNKIKRLNEKISNTDVKINEYKLIMERVLIRKEELE